MYKDVQFEKYMDTVYNRLTNGGLFLTVKGSRPNTMTIGWGGITHFWGRAIFIVPVRESRHTFGLMEDSREFTVSVPIRADVRDALNFCGTHSGRDFDKFRELGLTAVPGRRIDTPIVGECELHFECGVVYKETMNPKNLIKKIDDKHYPDYHTMYYGEILDCYLRDPDAQ